MLQGLTGIKFNVLTAFSVLTLLAFWLVWYSAISYQQLAYDYQSQTIQRLLELKTTTLTQAFFTRQENLANQIQSESSFGNALATSDFHTLKSLLTQSLHRATSKNDKIYVKSILLRDANADLLSAVYEDTSNPYNGCPVIIDRITAGNNITRQQTKFALCSQQNNLMSEVVVSVTSTDAAAYLHIISYVKDQLLSIDHVINFPISILNSKKTLLYQSLDWEKIKKENPDLKPVLYTLYGDDNVPGLVISAIYDRSGLNQQMKSNRLTMLQVTGGSLFIALLLILLWLYFSFRPLSKIRKSLGEVLNDHFVPIKNKGLPVELQGFASAYNQIIMVLEDASEKHNVAVKDLRTERDFISKTLDSITNSVLVLNSNLIIKLVNPAAEKLLGEYKENLIGYSFAENIILYTNRSVSRIANLQQLLVNPQQVYKLFYQQNDEIKELEMMASPMVEANSEDVGFVLVFKDVTEDQMLRRKLNFEARHEKLTGLLNRIAFESKFNEMVSEIDLSQFQHVFVYLNLDDFRVINQSCSSDAGDLLLKQVADSLRRNVRKSDLLACLGGDEFGLILSYAELQVAANTVSNILADICKTGFNWNDLEYSVTASAALIPFGRINGDLSEVFSSLTTACSLAKKNGGNQYYLIGDNDVQVQQHRSNLAWVARIKKGFVDKRFKLFVQPIEPVVSKQDKKFYEVLIRYQAEDGALILPVEFLGAAKRFNLNEKIDRWVVAEIIHWMAIHPELKGKIRFSINLSETSVDSTSFHRFLDQVLQTDLVDASSLCFEVTETSVAKDVNKSIEFIRQIKNLGASFSLDNFGSGISSLAHLQQLPIDYLKIDGVFIKGLLKDEHSSVFVRSMTELGHSLGMKVIAELVESTEIRQILADSKIDYLQGSAIEEPFSIESIEF